MKTLKILIITPGLGTGGAQKVFHQHLLFYSKHFEATGCIFNWDGALSEEKNLDMVSLDVPAGGNWLTKAYFFFQRIVRLRRIKRELDIDISISHLEGADYINILSRRGEKVICYIHGTKFHDGAIRGLLGWIRKKILMPSLYHKADLIIPVSKGIQTEFLTHLSIEPQKIKVITNGLDLEAIERQSTVPIPIEFENLLTGNKTICLCSRLALQKNQEIFVTIFASVQKITEAKLVILGDGELRNQLIDCAIHLGLRVFDVWSEKKLSNDFDIFFLGNQLNPFPYVKRTSLFALPSAWEGFPLALCEAMACGVPVVSSDCPTGPEEILKGEMTEPDYGLLLPIPSKTQQNTVNVWIKTLSDLMMDDASRIEYGISAKKRVQKFSKKNMETAWLEIVGQ